MRYHILGRFMEINPPRPCFGLCIAATINLASNGRRTHHRVA